VVYGLAIETGEGLVSETHFNGIQVARSHPGQMTVSSLAIHHDVTPGDNVAEAWVTVDGFRTGVAPTLTTVPSLPQAEARLMLEGDEARTEGEKLVVTTHKFAFDEWSATDAISPLLLPHRLRVGFRPTQPVEAPPWLAGERVSPAEIGPRVHAEMQRIAELIRTQDLATFTEVVAMARNHYARSYPNGPSAAELRETQINDLRALAARPGFAVEVRPMPRGRLRVQADGRLFDWVDGDDASLLVVTAKGMEPADLGLQFSVVQGRLRVTR